MTLLPVKQLPEQLIQLINKTQPTIKN